MTNAPPAASRQWRRPPEARPLGRRPTRRGDSACPTRSSTSRASSRRHAAARRAALALLRDRDFRCLVRRRGQRASSGTRSHYIALMWFAFDAGGPLGVIAVRLADSIPALAFGLHGGVVADRFDRRRLMIGAGSSLGRRHSSLSPIVGLTGHLSLWALVVAAFVLETATSYFAPAYGALLPALVERRNVQRANALVQASAQALSVGGWAAAAALVLVLPLPAFFAVNALSFVVSALLIARNSRRRRPRRATARAVRIREGLAALAGRRALAAGVVVLGVAITISSGSWIGGVPTLVRDTLGHGAGGFSVMMVGYAVGSIASGRRARTLARPAEGIREPPRVDALRPGVRAARCRAVARRRRRRRRLRRRRAELLARAAELRGAGGDTGRAARTRDGADLAHAPRRARDRAPVRRAALRGRARTGGLRGGGGRAAGIVGLAGATYTRSVEEPQLQEPRRVEPFDPERRTRRPRPPHRPASARRAPTRRPPRPCVSASSATRARISCSAAASQSSTFIDTWTSPARGRSSPSARTPGKPPPRSRTSAATGARDLERPAPG